MAYRLDLPLDMSSIHPVFHESILKRLLGDPNTIVPLEGVGVQENLTYKKVSIEILDRQMKRLCNKDMTLAKILWRNQLVERTTWEAESDMI